MLDEPFLQEVHHVHGQDELPRAPAVVEHEAVADTVILCAGGRIVRRCAPREIFAGPPGREAEPVRLS
jgi:hypothetical protein